MNSSATAHRLLTYYVDEGRIVRVKRGLYVTVPPGRSPEGHMPDRFLLGAKLHGGAVISHHSALEMHGVANTLHASEVNLTLASPGGGRFRWRGILYRTTRSPAPLARLGKEMWGVHPADIHGIMVPLTSIERSIVDAVARPGLGGGWEEIDHSVGSISYLRADLTAEYLRILGSPVLASRVGFLLERHAEGLGMEAIHLDAIAEMRPKSKVYLDGRKRESGRLMKRWNLIVPDSFRSEEWEGIP